ncbi:MalY/PatB family protein [Atlantibacter hermannii]|uniref:MalY/PatB family protein n=1 Tax=Atlantibacter hermannii TaxID=565 RepID=UPI0028AC2DDF|nr:PatB family C-S lyase [Atlantibacter hermannii]
MAFNFNEQSDRRHSDSVKWNKYPENVLPMWVADMDFPTAPCVLEALHQRVDHGIFGYGTTPDALFEVVIQHLKQRYQWEVKPEWLITLPGVVSGLNLAVRAFTEPHQRTLAPVPIYPPFYKASQLADRAQQTIPLVPNQGRWVMDLDAAQAEMRGDEKLLMLCNPQNPGGTVYRRDELMAQLAFAERHDLIVSSDEIHCELLLEPGLTHIPFASLNERAAQRSVTFISPSKTWNIAGLGASLAIIPNPELRRRFAIARQGIVPGVDVLSLTAATAAWRDGEPWRQALLAHLRRQRDRLCGAINAMPGLQVMPPEATYLAWVDASGLPVDDPWRFFLQHGLAFSPGKEFGDERFVRINFACSEATLDEAIARMQRAIATCGL